MPKKSKEETEEMTEEELRSKGKKEKYLSFSELTKPDNRIRGIARGFEGSKREIVKQIIEWIGENLERKKSKKETFRKRNVREIIKSGYCRNCSDQALVFITLARLKDIPTKYVYLLEGRRIKEDFAHRSGGHTVARCFIQGKWIYIDPSPTPLYRNFLGEKIKIPFNRFILYHEGKNWKELGLDDWKKMIKISRERPPWCEIKIPEKIFDWAMKKGKKKDKKPSELLRKLMERGFKKRKN